MLYRNGENLSDGLISFIRKSNSLRIFCPYIKLETLKEILSYTSVCKSITVRWEPNDIITGASDLSVYYFCKDNGIALYRNNRLHLKAYVQDYSNVFVASANISMRALNLPKNNRYNYELGAIIQDISFNDRLYFSKIENESTLITDNIFKQIKESIDNRTKHYDFNDLDFDLAEDEISLNSFLISALPLSRNTKLLFQIYTNEQCEDETDLNCAIHDLALYNVPSGLQYDDFFRHLKLTFFSQPFIQCLIDQISINKELYFGAVKNFIHERCTDVPLPRRWEITENIQILYSWLESLGGGKFIIDIPYSHSQRIRMV